MDFSQKTSRVWFFTIGACKSLKLTRITITFTFSRTPDTAVLTTWTSGQLFNRKSTWRAMKGSAKCAQQRDRKTCNSSGWINDFHKLSKTPKQAEHLLTTSFRCTMGNLPIVDNETGNSNSGACGWDTKDVHPAKPRYHAMPKLMERLLVLYNSAWILPIRTHGDHETESSYY